MYSDYSNSYEDRKLSLNNGKFKDGEVCITCEINKAIKEADALKDKIKRKKNDSMHHN